MSTITLHHCDRCGGEIAPKPHRKAKRAVVMNVFYVEDAVQSMDDLPSCLDSIKMDLCHDCWRGIRGTIESRPGKAEPAKVA